VTVARVGGRVLMVDESERVLLIHETLEHGGTHWLTPGGGLEEGEHPREAAAREAFEETGIQVTIDDDAEPVLTTRRDWSWRGVDYDQIDHFFLVRVPDGLSVQPRALTEIERETLLGSRWWTVADLTVTAELLVPSDLGAVLRRLLTDGR
jgi:8-oxo-dGTP pyrophosphatase MutT (NUDIX family)